MTTRDKLFDPYQATENQLEGDISQLLYFSSEGNLEARNETWEEKELLVSKSRGDFNR